MLFCVIAGCGIGLLFAFAVLWGCGGSSVIGTSTLCGHNAPVSVLLLWPAGSVAAALLLRAWQRRDQARSARPSPDYRY